MLISLATQLSLVLRVRRVFWMVICKLGMFAAMSIHYFVPVPGTLQRRCMTALPVVLHLRLHVTLSKSLVRV